MDMNEIFVQRFDSIDKKQDQILESMEQYRKESRDDRETLIRMDQSLKIYERLFDNHIECHNDNCKKNHKALYDNIFRVALVAIIVMAVSVIGFFGSKWMSNIESSIAKPAMKHELNIF
jgi:hypothetical protein